jgi:hypothetical protein
VQNSELTPNCLHGSCFFVGTSSDCLHEHYYSINYLCRRDGMCFVEGSNRIFKYCTDELDIVVLSSLKRAWRSEVSVPHRQQQDECER